jgi:Carboxypeptidase regulatory-like domain
VIRRLLGVAWLLAALAAATASAGTAGGLYGTVTEGPVRPVCQANERCDRPAAHLRLRFVRNGMTVAAARTDSRGRYRVTLRPGRYSVRSAGTGLGSVVKPSDVTVRADRYARVNLYRDTGIR